jgi:lysophospholipase L1-like esterase
MKKLLFALLFLAASPPILFGQNSGTITSSQKVCIDALGDKSTVGIQVTGTWTGTLQPQVSLQGQAAANSQVVPSTSTTPQSTITGNGVFYANVGGAGQFCILGNTVASGTATIFLNASKGVNASTLSFGGGSIASGTVGQPAVFTTGTALGSTPFVVQNTPGSFAGYLHNATNGNIARIGLIGDSVTQGAGTTLYINQWAQRMMRSLQTQFGYAGSGFQSPYSSAGYWNISAGCVTVNNLGPWQNVGTTFNALYQCTGNANTATIGGGASGKIYGDTLKVYYATFTDTGSGFTVAVDGGGPVTVGNTTTGTMTQATYSVAASAGWHTVVITFPAAGNAYLAGMEWTYGSQGAIVDNFGIGGATTNAFGAATATQMAFTQYVNAGGGDQLYFVSLGIDDFGVGITLANFTTQLGNIITYLQSTYPQAGIIILDEQNVNQAAGGSLTQAQVRTAEIAAAQQYNVGYMSIAQRLGSYATANTNGMMNVDGIHMNDKGNRDIGQMVLNQIVDTGTGLIDNFFANSGSGNLYIEAGNPAGTLHSEQNTQVKETCIGFLACGTGNFVNTGSNTAIGYQALQSLTTGHNNTALGNFSCGSLTTGNFTTCLGQNANVGAGTGGAVQFGSGTNSTNNTMQFQGWNFLNSAGAGSFSSIVTASDTGPFGSSASTASSACETSYAPTTLSTGGTTTNTGVTCLPANSVIDAVVYRITTAITTATNFTIGDATIAARFCATQSTLTLGTTGICFAQADQTGTSGPRQTAAAAVKITTTGTPGAGAIRLIVYYHTWTAPTS